MKHVLHLGSTLKSALKRKLDLKTRGLRKYIWNKAGYVIHLEHEDGLMFSAKIRCGVSAMAFARDDKQWRTKHMWSVTCPKCQESWEYIEYMVENNNG